MTTFKFLYTLENCGDDSVLTRELRAQTFHHAYRQFRADAIEAAGLEDSNVNVWSVEQTSPEVVS